MDSINGINSEEVQPYFDHIFVAPELVDEQGDVYQCGKCKLTFNALLEFLSHKKEHIATNIDNLSTELPLKNEQVNNVTNFVDPSNQIWVWNTGVTMTENSDGTITSDADGPTSKEIQFNDSLNLQKSDEQIICEESPMLTNINEVHSEKSAATPISLSCPVCNRVFKKQFDLYLHARTHTGEKPFQCIICGRTFSQKSNLKKHISSHRVWPDGLSKTLPSPGDAKHRGFSCPSCQSSFSDYKGLKTHLKEHGHQKVYKCIQRRCKATYVDLDSLISHIVTNHRSPEYHCHICFRVEKSLEAISVHQKSHTPGSGQQKQAKKLACMHCRAVFKKQSHLTHHLDTANHVNKCSHCSKTFVSERALRRHLALHDETLCFRCEVCGVSFRNKRYLYSHMLTHSKEKCFACSICEMKFSRKDILARHIKIHQPNKKKPCPFKTLTGCSMEFTRNDKLKLHIKSHVGKNKTKLKVKNLIDGNEKNSDEKSTIEIIVVPLTSKQCMTDINSLKINSLN